MRSQLFPYLFKPLEVGGISGVVDGVRTGPDYKSAESAMRVAVVARAPVLGRGQRNLQAAHRFRLPPLEGNHPLEAQVPDQVSDCPRHNGYRRTAGETTRMAHNPQQRGAVEVIHVRVRKQNFIDWRELLDGDAGTAQAA